LRLVARSDPRGARAGKAELVLADGDQIAVAQMVLADAAAVDEAAIPAVQVDEHPAFGRLHEKILVRTTSGPPLVTTKRAASMRSSAGSLKCTASAESVSSCASFHAAGSYLRCSVRATSRSRPGVKRGWDTALRERSASNSSPPRTSASISRITPCVKAWTSTMASSGNNSSNQGQPAP